MSTKPVICYVPAGTLPPSPSHEQVLEVVAAARRALEAGATPEPTPADALKLTLALPVAFAAQLETIGAAHGGLSIGRTLCGLLCASAPAAKAPSSHDSARCEARSTPVVAGLRDEQVRVVREAAPRLAAGQWALIEAGTGTGKSRIIAHLAAHVLTLRDHGHPFKQTPLDLGDQVGRQYSPLSAAGRAVAAWQERVALEPVPDQARTVILTAPTLTTVLHLAAEYSRVALTIDPEGKWKFGVVLGRGQFVSASAIRELLDNQETPDAAVEAWLERGCPAGASEASSLLLNLHPTISGLAEDLREIAQDFPVEDALLTPDCPEDEQAWYQALRTMAQSCDIVAVTHALLAVDNSNIARDRKTLLPRALALFVDEAHALEETQANCASQDLSLSRLKASLRNPAWSLVKAATQAKKALSVVERAYQDLRSIPEPLPLPVPAESRWMSAWLHARLTLGEMANELQALVKSAEPRSAPGKAARQVADVKAALLAVKAVLKGAPGSLSFSLAARYPQLLIGPKSVDGVLATRWESTPCGALLSGTLLTPTAAGRKAEPTMRRLALPAHRTPTAIETRPHWIRSTPTLFTPAATAAPGLTPPSGQPTAAELDAWLSNVAQVVGAEVAPSASGGTLVLMTGYDRLTLLAEKLKGLPGGSLASRVIAQQQLDLPLQQALREFKQRALAGDRPIWLALGGAWTGMDLRDERFGDAEAARDQLLSDLVIPAIPFGLNRTTTQANRAAFSGFQAHKAEALNTFSQGLGRLVRRDGLVNRRLWVLDGRLKNGTLTEFNKVLAEYPKRSLVGLPEAPVQATEAFYSEGAARSGQETGYERSKAARAACLAHYGYECAACAFDFFTRFGELGRDYIHVHHLTPLAEIGQEHQVDPVTDMRPLCPNCHAMAHRTNPPCSLEQLRELVELSRQDAKAGIMDLLSRLGAAV